MKRGDVLAVNGVFVGVYHWRLPTNPDLQAALTASPPLSWQWFVLLFNIVFAVTFAGSGLYALKRRISRVDEAFKVVVDVSPGTFAALLLNTALPVLPRIERDDPPFEQQIAALSWIATIVATLTLRLMSRRFLRTWEGDPHRGQGRPTLRRRIACGEPLAQPHGAGRGPDQRAR